MFIVENELMNGVNSELLALATRFEDKTNAFVGFDRSYFNEAVNLMISWKVLWAHLFCLKCICQLWTAVSKTFHPHYVIMVEELNLRYQKNEASVWKKKTCFDDGLNFDLLFSKIVNGLPIEFRLKRNYFYKANETDLFLCLAIDFPANERKNVCDVFQQECLRQSE